MKKHRIFSTLIESQKKSYELIMTSVLIAIGVNLLSTGIVELLGIQNKGIILIVIGMFISIGASSDTALFKNHRSTICF